MAHRPSWQIGSTSPFGAIDAAQSAGSNSSDLNDSGTACSPPQRSARSVQSCAIAQVTTSLPSAGSRHCHVRARRPTSPTTFPKAAACGGAMSSAIEASCVAPPCAMRRDTAHGCMLQRRPAGGALGSHRAWPQLGMPPATARSTTPLTAAGSTRASCRVSAPPRVVNVVSTLPSAAIATRWPSRPRQTCSSSVTTAGKGGAGAVGTGADADDEPTSAAEPSAGMSARACAVPGGRVGTAASSRSVAASGGALLRAAPQAAAVSTTSRRAPRATAGAIPVPFPFPRASLWRRAASITAP